jgi:hypothetical protein
LVCLDETSKQLIIETRKPFPTEPGKPKREDYEYIRNGVANLFMLFAPLEGWRHVKVTDRHAWGSSFRGLALLAHFGQRVGNRYWSSPCTRRRKVCRSTARRSQFGQW